MVRQCCRQNIPLSPFASVSGHMISLLLVPSMEKTRYDREWNQFKEIQISFYYVFKYKWLLGEPDSQGTVYKRVYGAGNLPVSKKGREQTQIGKKGEEERRELGRRPSLLLSRSYWMNPAVCTFWKIYLMETWTHKHTFIRKAELFTY